MNIIQIKTWADLKGFANQLTEEQLNQVVRYWGEEKGGTVDNIDILDEDFVQTDYGCEPSSVQEYEADQELYPVKMPKGTIIFSVQ